MLSHWVNRFWHHLLDRLYPPTCVLCRGDGEPGWDLCAACREELPRNTRCCSVCAIPLPLLIQAEQRCGVCQRHPPGFDRVTAPFLYTYPLRELIITLKFQQQLALAPLLGRLLAEELLPLIGAGDAFSVWPEVIMPVPLHPHRLRERGFNQALELARPLARQLQIPLDLKVCQRIHHTVPLSSLTAKARRSAIRGAFAVTTPSRYRHVVLLDDVVTTGSTVNELATLLLRSGVERVDVWALARTAQLVESPETSDYTNKLMSH